MATINLTVSPYLADLYDLYCGELQLMARDNKGQESEAIFNKTCNTRRKNSAHYYQLMVTNPEFAAPMFHNFFRFGKNSIAEMTVLLSTNGLAFPTPKFLLQNVTLESGAQKFLSTIPSAGGDEFLAKVIGLEYLRSVGWSNSVPEVAEVGIGHGPDSDDDSNDDGGSNPLSLGMATCLFLENNTLIIPRYTYTGIIFLTELGRVSFHVGVEKYLSFNPLP